MPTAVDRLRVDAPVERLGADYRLDEFVLDPAARAVRFEDGRGLNVAGTVVDTSMSLTIEGASTVELTVQDTGGTLLNGDLLTEWAWGKNADDRDEAHWLLKGRKIDAQLDDIWLRLTVVEILEGEQLKLTFEDREVAKLRAHKGPKKVYREAEVTLAKFIASLCREANVEFYIPELDKRQPVEKAPDTLSVRERREQGASGLSGKVKVKGDEADREQRDNMQLCLSIAERMDASELVMLAMLVAGTGESSWRKGAAEQVYGTHKGVFQSNVIPASDLKGQCYHFLKGGRSFLAGGAIGYANKHPHASPGEIATAVEISDGSAGYYNDFLPEARRNLKAFKPSLSSVGEIDLTVERPFAYSRGKDEDSWDCIQRYADLVQWRGFIRKGRLWWASEGWLFDQQSQLTLERGKNGVDEITGPIDLGARDLVADLTVQARLGRWTALPGMRATVEKRGPASGGWLIHQIDSTLTDEAGTITIAKPLPAKAEPANETDTLTLTGSSVLVGSAQGPVGKVLQKAIEISRRNFQYSWGGGHNNSFSPSGPHDGYDCSGYVSACLHAAGLLSSPLTSGSLASWGQAGKGKYFTVYANAGHTFIVFHGLGKYKRADTSPQGGEPRRGPHVRTENRSTGGFAARHWKGL